jgi:aldose 1-epimerase
MRTPVVTLQNEFWQVGILPSTGASIAFGRVRQGDTWVDVLRPTPESDYDNSSKCSSFIMMPWCNRIRDGVLRFNGQTYMLRTEADDGTARHGDVRRRNWRIASQDDLHIRMTLDSREEQNINFPFAFSASATYGLQGNTFIWGLTLTNEDTQPFPAGFGHHPYFVRTDDVQLSVPCDGEFVLTNTLATGAPTPVRPEVDFRQPRPLPAEPLDHVLTARQLGEDTVLDYPASGVRVVMSADTIFNHVLLFAPTGKPFFAVEPMTNVNDGFSLYEQGIAESGIFVVQPGETVQGAVRLTVPQPFTTTRFL